jgi:hypothetical protein
MPTASTIGSSFTQSSFASAPSATRSKFTFIDMVAVDFEHDEEKFIKEFGGLLDTQSLTNAVKCVPLTSLNQSFDL